MRHVTFASNPCRVRYFTQEIVLFREDLLKKMQRHLAVPLTLDDPSAPDITEQLVETLLDQAHLCPLPLHAKPVYWELDYTLRLFPLPHLVSGLGCNASCFPAYLRPRNYCLSGMHLSHSFLFYSYFINAPQLPLTSSQQLVLADHVDHFNHSYRGCNTVNPGR